MDKIKKTLSNIPNPLYWKNILRLFAFFAQLPNVNSRLSKETCEEVLKYNQKGVDILEAIVNSADQNTRDDTLFQSTNNSSINGGCMLTGTEDSKGNTVVKTHIELNFGKLSQMSKTEVEEILKHELQHQEYVAQESIFYDNGTVITNNIKDIVLLNQEIFNFVEKELENEYNQTIDGFIKELDLTGNDYDKRIALLLKNQIYQNLSIKTYGVDRIAEIDKHNFKKNKIIVGTDLSGPCSLIVELKTYLSNNCSIEKYRSIGEKIGNIIENSKNFKNIKNFFNVFYNNKVKFISGYFTGKYPQERGKFFTEEECLNLNASVNQKKEL